MCEPHDADNCAKPAKNGVRVRGRGLRDGEYLMYVRPAPFSDLMPINAASVVNGTLDYTIAGVGAAAKLAERSSRLILMSFEHIKSFSAP